jgi:cobalt-zinc-cadmium efflux system outer membrane protein
MKPIDGRPGPGRRNDSPSRNKEVLVKRASRIVSAGLSVLAALGLCGRQAHGQGTVTLADEIIIISSGERAKEQARGATRLGPIHGVGERAFPRIAGADDSRLGERLPAPRPLDTLQAASRPNEVASSRDLPSPIERPAVPSPTQPEVPLYGVIARPDVEDEGPAGGLTLEQAIVQLERSNPDLAVKFQEIPKADADILTAGLWGNPLVFAASDGTPYGNYSVQRPGSNTYSITVVQPLDVNGKIRARTRLARANREVLCAQYQDAVRLEAENLHAAFVDVLAARTTVRYLQTSVANFENLLETAEDRVKKGAAPESELDTALIQRETTANAEDEAVVRLRQAKRRLAILLGIPASQADALELRGTIHDRAPEAPPVEQLVGLAVANRPDLAATRIGVRSAVANAELQRRERFPDVFALYTPYGFSANNDNPSARSATSWGAGIFATVPILNRNQGNIHRADRNVMQTQMEASGLERQVAAEVENATLEYASSRRAVERIERSIIPRAEHRLESYRRLYTEGQENLDLLLNAQRDFNEVIRQYRDTLVRHRRAMLALNTVLGVRLLP